VQTGDQVREETKAEVDSALSFINYFLLAFGAIALLVGPFIIYNTFSMIVAQRLRELALLRAIGASRAQVGRSVVTEALVVGLIGSII
ncbi:FtsX-like permease family protein, partial [Staphylococcus aureus]|uniref:FtsX-like permease family protein n=1 Tax=Staphylococcus aureus TaxID=1280 RepID=UPI0038B2DFD5